MDENNTSTSDQNEEPVVTAINRLLESHGCIKLMSGLYRKPDVDGVFISVADEAVNVFGIGDGIDMHHISHNEPELLMLIDLAVEEHSSQMSEDLRSIIESMCTPAAELV